MNVPDSASSALLESGSLYLSLRRITLSIIRLVLLVYVGVCGLMMAMESRIVYQPPLPSDSVQEAEQHGAEEVWFLAEDQTKLHGWFFPANDKGSTRAILYLHGNGEDADQNVPFAADLRDRLQASVFVFDYRGYGHSEGTPFESGVVSDGLAAQRWLAERVKLKPDQIILYGRSLGGAVAVAAAAQLGARGLILINTFANMTDVAAAHYSFLPVRYLMRNRFALCEQIAKYSGPVLQFHGTADTVIPIQFGRPLCDAAPTTSKQFVEIPDGNHNDPLPEYCYDALVEFLDSLPQ